MPTTPLPLNTSPAAAAWAFAVRAIKTNADITRLRPEYQLPEEPNWQNDPPTDRVTIRLSPKLSNGQTVAVAGFGRVVKELTLTIGVDAFIPSDLWPDAANIALAIEQAIQGTALQPGPRVQFEQAWNATGVLERVVSLPPDWSQTGTITLTLWAEV